MGLSRVEAICDGLIGAGLPSDWPIMLIANASLPQQQTLVGTLADMPRGEAADIRAPVISDRPDRAASLHRP